MKKLWLLIQRQPFYIRWRYVEFWPMFFYYVPVLIQHLWLSLKAHNFFFFLRTNPAIDGFILSDSKYKTLQLSPPEYLPKTILVKKGDSLETVNHLLQEAGIGFPVILKPDIGFRGLSVKKVTNEVQLCYLLSMATVDYLIQEYIDFPVEVGIFYYRLPESQQGVIPSITLKEFLTVTGDGKHTLAELIFQNPRAILQAPRLKRERSAQWNCIIPENETIFLEGIGNHNRGTKFTDARYLIEPALLKVFDELNQKMKGFYFGRFDIRTPSLEILKSGTGFKILEINGVGAEPTHIYQPGYRLGKAWKELMALWQVVYTIARQNQRAGIALPSFSEGRKKWNAYRAYKKRLSESVLSQAKSC